VISTASKPIAQDPPSTAATQAGVRPNGLESPADPTASLWWHGRRGGTTGSGSTGAIAAAVGGDAAFRRSAVNSFSEVGTIDMRAGQPALPARFSVLQKWEGTVLSVDKETFSARLLDLNGDRPDQEASIYLEELSPRDLQRLVPGAVFYWYLGYRDEPNGDRERASRIRLRRLPPLSVGELVEARAWASRLRARLGWRD
jgi:hypothetical protein